MYDATHAVLSKDIDGFWVICEVGSGFVPLIAVNLVFIFGLGKFGLPLPYINIIIEVLRLVSLLMKVLSHRFFHILFLDDSGESEPRPRALQRLAEKRIRVSSMPEERCLQAGQVAFLRLGGGLGHCSAVECVPLAPTCKKFPGCGSVAARPAFFHSRKTAVCIIWPQVGVCAGSKEQLERFARLALDKDGISVVV